MALFSAITTQIFNLKKARIAENFKNDFHFVNNSSLELSSNLVWLMFFTHLY